MSKNSPYKLLPLLTALCGVFLVCSLVTQNRFITLGHYYFTASVIISPLTFITLDIIAEVYGYQRARMALWTAILCTFIFTGLMTAVLNLPGPTFWQPYDHAFNKTMDPVLRILSLDTVSLVIGQLLNIFLISKFKQFTRGRFFAIRSVMSSICGDTTTLIIAMIAIFSRTLHGPKVIEIIITEAIILYLLAFILAFPGAIIANLLKKIEGSDPIDRNINYNPFSLKLD